MYSHTLLLLLASLVASASASRVFIPQHENKFIGRDLLSSDCPAGEYYPAPPSYPPPAAYPPPSGAASPPYPPPAAYPPPATYPPPAAYPPPAGSGCMSCPEGTYSEAGATGIDSCKYCPGGQFSYNGVSCAAVAAPAFDSASQRRLRFEYYGPVFDVFLSQGPEYVQSFNSTTTNRLEAGSAFKPGTWLYDWKSGSIVADYQLSYPAGTTGDQMNDDVNYLVNNAAAVFGDLSAFGVTGIRGECLAGCPDDADGDDNKALAIGLGVGLGVGIPLIAGIIFFCIWKKRRAEQNVAPLADQSA